ncbi:MAG: hypothetical protein KKF89_04055 [Nanoarchaeota archaeon]|nr:hypothetical protein [Nanoarchaeota archaeon]MBU1854868.1 hypothetical protein [Nanoarchaeota archaeon]
MNLTKKEKELIKQVLKQHLKEVEATEKIPNQNIQLLSTEMKYEDFIKSIINKL